MKRTSTAAIITCFIFLFSYCFSFAEGLTLVKSYPADGAKGLEITNQMVKLEFSQNISDASVKAQNEKCFTVADDKGKAVKYQVLFNKENTKVGVLINETLKSNQKYVVTIDGALKGADGSTLGTTQKINFSTRDMSKDQGTGIFMIIVVAGAASLLAIKSAKQKMAEEKEKSSSNKNPYNKGNKETHNQYKHTPITSKPKKKK